PFAGGDPVVSMGEGSTPLVLAERLSERVGAEAWLKLEGLNPTGSFKDRGMTCAVSAAVREGAEAVVCASTGNTAARAAAYAARAALRCAVIVPQGKIAAGKLAQPLRHGARGDAEILGAYGYPAAHEGVFCEPAAAASVAGLLKFGVAGPSRIACVLTGQGLKDPQTALDQAAPVVPCDADLTALERAVMR